MMMCGWEQCKRELKANSAVATAVLMRFSFFTHKSNIHSTRR